MNLSISKKWFSVNKIYKPTIISMLGLLVIAIIVKDPALSRNVPDIFIHDILPVKKSMCVLKTVE